MKTDNTIKVRSNHTYENLIERLISFGYNIVDNIVNPGEINNLGGNILIFPTNVPYPIKIELFGKTIDRIISYDLKTSKTIKAHTHIKINSNLINLPDKSKISPGEYIVHDDHGIGIYLYKITKNIDNALIHYMAIEYLNNSILYVPESQLIKISRYIGIGRKKPKLNKLGSETWRKTYKKTYENIIHLARELLEIYAKREIIKRKPLIINNEWEDEISKTFGYRYTSDQNDAIKDVYSDLKRKYPTDRLICGDVGFGKTEVAIRATTQSIANGYQVAFLVPTTILAEQHYFTLKERFRNLPIEIARLSRFIGTSEQNKTIESLNNGKIDLVVGTHKLFNSHIKFKNLGLLVVDEEQKFGVKDKEKIKKYRTNIDVITLTATPIPRTLFMSLSGIRDLSQISTSPVGRKQIITTVSKYSEDDIIRAIKREKDRNGQIYYMHNEVSTIGGVKNKLMKLFPNLIIEVAHGQQSEKTLSQTMSDFTQGKVDILVCSTIIENGLDLPNVNTLIVENADKFGLSQLYQIRGRIGRSKKQAYAIFTHKDKKITDTAFKRFKALIENTELGSGYNIALSDLEIRGGGNILGREQHGNMEAIGLVLYSKLLTEAVNKLKTRTK